MDGLYASDTAVDQTSTEASSHTPAARTPAFWCRQLLIVAA